MRRIASVFAIVSVTLMLTGCGWSALGSSDRLNVTSQRKHKVELTGEFATGYYRYDSPNAITMVLVDGSIKNPKQAATIRLFWQPYAGYTPVDPTATNATIHYMIFADSAKSQSNVNHQVGVYSGAGFLYLDQYPGGQTLRASLWQASVRLTDRSADFVDQLGQSILEGAFTVKRNPGKVEQLLHELSTQVTDRLGYPRLVRSAIDHPHNG